MKTTVFSYYTSVNIEDLPDIKKTNHPEIIAIRVTTETKKMLDKLKLEYGKDPAVFIRLAINEKLSKIGLEPDSPPAK